VKRKVIRARERIALRILKLKINRLGQEIVNILKEIRA
jgi:hypothetical protein